jgi:uncharacterized protein
MDIQHDAERGQFFVRMGDDEAALTYTRRGDVLDFQHIFVPPAFRGTGAAARILKFGFDYARRHNCKVVPTCPYIAGQFLPRFPQYQDLVAQDE